MRDECIVKNCKVSQDFWRLLSGREIFKTCYTCNVFVDRGVIDGAEHDGDDKNFVSHLCDVMSREGLSVCFFGSVPA